MRKISILFLTFILLANNTSGSPLIFTISKEIPIGKLTEIAAVDTAKYKQIRIAVDSENGSLVENTSAYIELVRKRTEAEFRLSELKQTLKERHPDVLAKQEEVDTLNQTIEGLKKTESDSTLFVRISAVENGKEIELTNSEENRSKRSFVIDSPPAKIKILVKGRGKFTVYIWGQ